MLLAGAWSLFSDKPATPADARAWVEARNAEGAWTEQKAQQEDSDETQCLNYILQHVVRASTSRGNVDISVAELVKLASGDSSDLRHGWSVKTLGRLGLRGDPDCMVVSSTHSGVANILRDTPWARNWGRILRRLPGACPTEAPIRFGAVTGRGVEIPWPTEQPNPDDQ